MGTRAMTQYASPLYSLPDTVDTIFQGPVHWNATRFSEERQATRTSLSDPDRSWIGIVQRQATDLAALQENWDGYGAAPIRKDVLWYALYLLQSITESFPPPHLTPMSHEGIMLEWHRGRAALEIEIENAGEGHVAYEDDECNIDETWQVEWDFTSLVRPLTALAEKDPAAIVS